MADLLVRSDIFDKNFAPYHQNFYKSSFNHRYHYVVVEIKNKKFYLNDLGVISSKTSDILAYKSQLYIYTLCLNDMQNISNNCAYFIGRYHQIGKTIYQPLTYGCLPVVNFLTVDSHIPLATQDAIKWVRNVKNNGYGWSVMPPTNNFLYPNMKSKYNTQYYRHKLEIAKELGEITLIMFCGIKQRNMAFSKGIFSWKDPLLRAEIMGFKNKRSRLVNSIIDINRQPDKLLSYKSVPDVSYDPNTTIFLDIETFDGMVYMIGLIYGGRYFNFIVESLNIDQEKTILQNFQQFIFDNNITTIFHHSQFDIRVIKSRCAIHLIENNITSLQTIDTYQIFYNNEIVVKGLFDYKLKNIWAALKYNNLIQTNGDILNKCKGGGDSLNLAYLLYKKQNKPCQNTLTEYNHFDCKVLHDIVNFLRH